MVSKNFLLFMILAIALFLSNGIPRGVFALSPSFARQEITDDSNGWTIVKAYPGVLFSVKTPYGDRDAEYGQNETNCRIAQKRDSDQGRFHPPDISAVTYISSGKTLNVTLWLSSPFTEIPSNASDWLTLPRSKDVPWYIIRYGMTITVPSVYDTEGTDYRLDYRLDILNNTWTRTVEEVSPQGDFKVLQSNHNYSVFHLKAQKYINLFLDLAALNYPDEYVLLFYAFDYFIEGYRICPMADITSRVHIPPPEFGISSSPSSVELRPGEHKSIELNLKSNANIKSRVLFSGSQTDELKDKIKFNFTTNNISVPLNGIVTSKLDIKASENVEADSYTLPISANISVITEDKPRRGGTTGEILYNPTDQVLFETSNLTVTVLPSLTLLDYINNILNSWGAPVKELIGLITAIGSIGAVVFGTVKWIRRKQKKTG
jgi:hypothetical protein